MDYPFTLPGHPGLKLALRPGGFFSSLKILQDGVPLKREKGVFLLPQSKGPALELKIKTGFDVFSPKVLFAGQQIEVLPRISPLWQVWAYIPVLLMFVGGALGGFLGACGAVGALSALRSNLPPAVKILLAIILPPLSVFIYLVVAILIATKLPH